MEERQERFWLESEANHRSLVSWWRGFACGIALAFIGCFLVGLYL